MRAINQVTISGHADRVKTGTSQGGTGWAFFTVIVPRQWTNRKTGEIKDGKTFVQVKAIGEVAGDAPESGDWVEVCGYLDNDKGTDDVWRTKVQAVSIFNVSDELRALEAGPKPEPDLDDDDDIPF